MLNKWFITHCDNSISEKIQEIISDALESEMSNIKGIKRDARAQYLASRAFYIDVGKVEKDLTTNFNFIKRDLFRRGYVASINEVEILVNDICSVNNEHLDNICDKYGIKGYSRIPDGSPTSSYNPRTK